MKRFILLSMLAYCTAQETTPTPPSRKQPVLNPSLDMVFAQFPETTPVGPVFKPVSAIPPNRKQPVISKADIVMAATDRVGILVNNLAQDLAMDLNNIINNLPVANPAPKGGKRVMESQQAVEDEFPAQDFDDLPEDIPDLPSATSGPASP